MKKKMNLDYSMLENQCSCNHQSFDKSDIEKGLFQKFLDSLLEIQRTSSVTIDINISYDGLTTIVSWVSNPYPRTYGGSFQVIANDDEEEIGVWVENKDTGALYFVPKSFSKEETDEYLDNIE